MIIVVRNFSGMYKERPQEVVFIQEHEDGKVPYCCLERIDSKVMEAKV
jgi:hypothetical protein